jgi:carbamoyltransferase
MLILGISAFYHDSAAALVRHGDIVAAAQEERFTRIRHDASFPEHAVAYCLARSGATLRDVDYVVFYEKPWRKFGRLLRTYAAYAPRGFDCFAQAMGVWLGGKLFQRRLLCDRLRASGDGIDRHRILFSEHHLSHAASAFFPSPFGDAAILTADGVGELATTSVGMGSGNSVRITKEIHFPHSLGLLYSAFTHYLGFRVNSGEYKLMGLAPFGRPRYAQTILDHLIDIKADGSFRLNMKYFDYCVGTTMITPAFECLFEGALRKPESAFTERHADLAASIQDVLNRVVLSLTRSLAAETGSRNLCMAGGVALNCVTNGLVLRDGRFKRIWIQPASGDAGGALGAALLGHYTKSKEPRQADPEDSMRGALLGPSFPQECIEARLTAVGAKFDVLDDQALLSASADALARGEALGWFQGAMEFGPRALGNRSILGDPRPTGMRQRLNRMIKLREEFRPFAPSVLREDLREWFDLDCESPYMLLVAEVAAARRFAAANDDAGRFGLTALDVPMSEIAAVTHVDYSARIQTVDAHHNPRFHALLQAFKIRSGCPVLLNTSFNVRGEPIVHTPEEAFRCFMATGLDTLAIGNCLLRKQDQDSRFGEDYLASIQPD